MSTRTTLNIYDARNILLKHMGYDTYQVYLDSEVWKGIRKRVLARDKWKCKICDMPAEAVHHNKYDQATLLGTNLKHLASICNDCHQAVEFKDGVKVSGGEARKRFLCPKFRKAQRDRQWFAFNDRKGNAELDAEYREIVTSTPRETVMIPNYVERHDTMQILSGKLEFKCPSRMTADDFDTLCRWLDVIKGVLHRSLITEDEQKEIEDPLQLSKRPSLPMERNNEVAPLAPMMRKTK